MEISLADAKKLNWLWQDENKVEWIETFIKIADKKGNIVPFHLTPEQKKLLTGLEHKNIVSKSRQLGISVLVASAALREAVIYPNSTSMLISHNQSSTTAVFDKLKQMYYSLPDFVRPKLIQNNRQALTFENNSSITCLTAGNKDCARGSTINSYLWCSEFAFWKDQERQMKSIMQAVSSSTKVILESTSNGFNFYQQTFMGAKNGENGFKPFFFNWIQGSTLFSDQYKQSAEAYKARHNGKMLTEDEYDEEEKYLATLGMSPEQAVWRRDKISISGLDAFHVEYPSTPEESFLTTSASVFDSIKITRLQQSIIEKKIKPLSLDKIVGLPTLLRPHVQNRNLKIWEIPKVGIHYVAGIDVAEGLGGNRDSSTIFIMDNEGKQVLQFSSNKIKPYEFSEIIDVIGRWYFKALLVVEKASGGHSCIERLRYEKKYMNMYKSKSYDEFKRTIWKVGYDTTQKTKSLAVNDMREWFDKGLIDIQSYDLLEEMKTFVAEDNGAFNAISSCHDDLVSSCWLAIQGAKSGFWYPF